LICANSFMKRVIALRERIVAWVVPYMPLELTFETIQLIAGVIFDPYLLCSFIQAIVEIAVDSITKFKPIELVMEVKD